MVPTLSAQLCLGLCLCWGVWAQVDSWPRPSLRAEPGSVIPQGNPVTLWCEGPPGAELYRLWKEGGYLDVEMSAEGWGARHLIPYMAAETAGRYRCRYMKQSWWSEISDPLELRVTGVRYAPFLSAVPSSQVTPGQDVTLQCRSLWWYDRSALVKEGQEVTYRHAQGTGRGAPTNFSLPAVTPAQAGTYRCHSFDSNSPYVWSGPSDPLVLRVTANPGLSSLHVGILLGASTVLILLFLLLLLLLLYRQHWRHQARLRKGARKAKAKKTPKSSDPAGTPLEETPDVNVDEDRQTEEARPEDTAAPPPEDPQELTYALLNLSTLRVRAEEPPPSGPVEPSLYAALK
ncbi:platelet glycoprotein VI-like isoform X1 [Macrotis lagotis]|uniref:platelet glycoprotein VI-like isoform X1 n=1 Tax=Macrotis lagotis TaxID=92651 RepID=UPI003D695902